MELEEVRKLVFESLSDSICQLGCAGPPECKNDDCEGRGKHDTGLSMCLGEIYIEIDDKTFQVSIKQIPQMP